MLEVRGHARSLCSLSLRHLLQKNRQATIVVVCPSIALSVQQACVFVVEGFLEDRYWVSAFSSNNQLIPQAWRHLACAHNVMVMTPQLLLNVMDFYKDVEGYSIFTEIDLLILDECHHVRKEHAYNKIMTAHREAKGRKPQVLGFTASPTRSPDLEEGEENLKKLLDQMQAVCLVLGEESPEVQHHVPSAKEETAYAEVRIEDDQFARSIGRFVYSACQRYIQPLIGRVNGVFKLSDRSLTDLGMGMLSSSFENWAKLTSEKIKEGRDLSTNGLTDFLSAIELLRACNSALELIQDTGFESALKVLAQRMVEINTKLGAVADEPGCIFPGILAGIYSCSMVQSVSPVLHAYSMSPNPTIFSSFPRFIILVKFLERFMDQETLHGMVFVKTRDGVYHIAKMLRYEIHAQEPTADLCTD